MWDPHSPPPPPMKKKTPTHPNSEHTNRSFCNHGGRPSIKCMKSGRRRIMYFVLIWQPDNVPESLWRMIENYQKLTGQSDLDSKEDKKVIIWTTYVSWRRATYHHCSWWNCNLCFFGFIDVLHFNCWLTHAHTETQYDQSLLVGKTGHWITYGFLLKLK